jgi:transketolase
MISRRLLCRNLSGAVLNALANVLPELLGGSADLTPSNKTDLKGVVDFQKHSRNGRYIRFGVREHAMAAICNGMASYGAIIPYCGTFLNFIGYAMGAVRLSALSHFRVLYVATHDSIGLGEDGPTHQPVELMEGLRATPNMFVYRPADGNETSAAYAAAILNSHAPAILALSRQNLPHLAGSSIEKALKGGYTVFDTAEGSVGKPDLIVAATGSEVTIAIDGAKAIAAGGKRVQVASMPCLEIFDRQTLEYRQSVLGEGIPVLTIEASAVKGWERYGHAWIGMTTFGYSGPYLVSFGATPKFQ